MRWMMVFVGFALFALSARAQQQENNLVNRLLRPDVTLANSAQNKKFTAVEGTSIDKKFVARSYYSGDHIAAKGFTATKDFSSKKFRSKKFSPAQEAANAVAKAFAHSGDGRFETRESSLTRAAAEGKKRAVGVRDYTDNRPFLAKGTRQEALSREDKPLTIQEVRDLLNKN